MKRKPLQKDRRSKVSCEDLGSPGIVVRRVGHGPVLVERKVPPPTILCIPPLHNCATQSIVAVGPKASCRGRRRADYKGRHYQQSQQLPSRAISLARFPESNVNPSL